MNVSEYGFAHNLDVYASIRCVCIFVSVYMNELQRL